MLPTLFISRGSPMPVLEPSPARDFPVTPAAPLRRGDAAWLAARRVAWRALAHIAPPPWQRGDRRHCDCGCRRRAAACRLRR
jgi:hypothetical protein